MHARLIRLKGSPEGAEERRAGFEQEAVPAMREQPGFMGVVVLADADTGGGAVVTYWESEEAMSQSLGALADLRERTTAGQGLEVLSLEQYEVILMERRGTPVPGNGVRLSRFRADGDAAALLREAVEMAATLAGFKAFIAGVDRSGDRVYVVTGWETPADRDATDEAAADYQARVGESLGLTDLEVEKYEVSLASMPASVSGS